MAVIVVMMLEFLETGLELTGSVRLLVTVGEETGEYGAAQLTDAEAEFLRAAGEFTSIEMGPGGDTSNQVNEYVSVRGYLQAIEAREALVPELLAKQRKVKK